MPAAAPIIVDSRAREDLRTYVRSFFRREPRLSASEWCEHHIYLPVGKQETEPGPVRFDTRPYLREIVDSIADPACTDIVFVAPTRLGKTFTLRMCFAWSIAADPAATMWVDSTESKGQDVSRKELQPLVEANAILRDRKPRNRHNYTDLRMLFPGASFTIVGGNSDAQVAGDTVKRIFGNELDKWRLATDREASIAELVRHRTESFDEERKHIWSSTPTLEELTTWTFARRGDMRKWQCICPDCSHAQPLEWDHVKWSPEAKITESKWDYVKVKETARYQCASCGSLWTDPMRHAAIRHPSAHYIPTQPATMPGWRSYLVNGLYGPLKSNNVGELAVDFLAARTTGFHADRRDFWNSRMGLPWRDNPSDISVEKFASLERPYLRGEAGPANWKPDLIIIGFDVQSNRLPWIARAYSLDGTSYLIDHGDAPTWADLDRIQADYTPLARRSYVIGDINYEDRRAETLEQIYRRRDRGWFGAEGFEQTSDLVKLEKANVFLGGRLQKEGHYIHKLIISTYDFKVDLEKRISGELKNMFYYQLPIVATPSEIEEQREYYAQRLDERRRPRPRPIPGKPSCEFHSKNKNNHYNDCELYALALFWVLAKQYSYAHRRAPITDRQTVEINK